MAAHKLLFILLVIVTPLFSSVGVDKNSPFAVRCGELLELLALASDRPVTASGHIDEGIRAADAAALIVAFEKANTLLPARTPQIISLEAAFKRSVAAIPSAPRIKDVNDKERFRTRYRGFEIDLLVWNLKHVAITKKLLDARRVGWRSVMIEVKPRTRPDKVLVESIAISPQLGHPLNNYSFVVHQMLGDAQVIYHPYFLGDFRVAGFFDPEHNFQGLSHRAIRDGIPGPSEYHETIAHALNKHWFKTDKRETLLAGWIEPDPDWMEHNGNLSPWGEAGVYQSFLEIEELLAGVVARVVAAKRFAAQFEISRLSQTHTDRERLQELRADLVGQVKWNQVVFTMIRIALEEFAEEGTLDKLSPEQIRKTVVKQGALLPVEVPNFSSTPQPKRPVVFAFPTSQVRDVTWTSVGNGELITHLPGKSRAAVLMRIKKVHEIADHLSGEAYQLMTDCSKIGDGPWSEAFRKQMLDSAQANWDYLLSKI